MKKAYKNSVEEEILSSFFVLFGNNFNITPEAMKCIQPLEIKIAFRKRALETHPDRAKFFGKKESEMVEQFKRVTEAYERLCSYSNDNWNCLKGVSFSRESVKKASDASKEKPAKEEKRGWRFTGFSHSAGPEPDVKAGAGKDSSAGPGRGSDYSSGNRAGSEKKSQGAERGGWGQTYDRPYAKSGAAAAGGQTHSFSSKNSASGNNAGRAAEGTYFKSGMWGVPQIELLFGQFLYYSGKVSWESLIKAIIWQRCQRPSFGQIAHDWNILSHKDIKEILENRDFNDKFGDSALRQGFITSFEHMAIMGKQRNLQQRIGEFFIENGFLSADDMKEMLSRHRSHNFNIRIRKKVTA